jgi:hypothetical protein
MHAHDASLGRSVDSGETTAGPRHWNRERTQLFVLGRLLTPDSEDAQFAAAAAGLNVVEKSLESSAASRLTPITLLGASTVACLIDQLEGEPADNTALSRQLSLDGLRCALDSLRNPLSPLRAFYRSAFSKAGSASFRRT